MYSKEQWIEKLQQFRQSPTETEWLEFKEGVISSSKNLDKALKFLSQEIEGLFKENYDGFHDGRPGPTYSGQRFFDMFLFSATDRENWKIKLELDHQYEPCFNPNEGEKALNIVKTYLTLMFKEKIQEIQMDHKKIHIRWKT